VEDEGMRVSVYEAEGQLAELVRRARAGDDVVLTSSGRATVRLVPIEEAKPTAAKRRAVMEEVQASARLVVTDGPDAAQSQDFLYDDNGLPK
jgi:prevent-host-death family protein